MLICGKCGHPNADPDTFCGACGKFLEWDGKRVKVEVAPALIEQAEEDATKRGLLVRIRRAAHELVGGTPLPDSKPAKKPEPAEAPPAAPPGLPPGPPPGMPPGMPPGLPPGMPPGLPPGLPPGMPPGMPGDPAGLVDFADLPDDPADLPGPERHLAAPVVETEPPEQKPQPDRPRAVTVSRVPPRTKPRPGDLICGECGEGNPVHRKFCRRCGDSLATAEVAKRPWWRRLLPRRRVRKAGSRPSRPGDGRGRRALSLAARRIRAAIGVVILVGGLVVGLYPPLRTAALHQVDRLRQWVLDTAETALGPVRPSTVDGPGGSPDHPPKAAFDTFKNTYWATTWDARKRPSLVIKLNGPVALRKVIVTSGASDAFAAHGRPASLEFSYSNEKSDIVSVRDSPQPQELALTNAVGVTGLKITVSAVHAAQDAKDVAVAEVELFGIGG
ncbi:NADase-type glycan-binding domain-containing protein [Amycolatopsis sp. lyj-84]|uniref:NADase-type glycan-binding domain-containing protein n=1 Tax=Amycolatopsis sp. lyj-84 TaxID=2789284 RepID=UPI00397877CA